MSENTVTIPVEPPVELLVSMAVRYDHGLAIPGHYDQEMFSSAGVSHAQRFESALSTMRQLYEEVVGRGFYSGGKKEFYQEIRNRATCPPARPAGAQRQNG